MLLHHVLQGTAAVLIKVLLLLLLLLLGRVRGLMAVLVVRHVQLRLRRLLVLLAVGRVQLRVWGLDAVLAVGHVQLAQCSLMGRRRLVMVLGRHGAVRAQQGCMQLLLLLRAEPCLLLNGYVCLL